MRKEMNMKMEPQQINGIFYTRFSFLGKQYRFSLKTTNLKIAHNINEQIKRGLERGMFNSFEPGAEGERVLRNLIARPGLRAEEAVDELNATTRRIKLEEAKDLYLQNCKAEHTAKNYTNEERIFKSFAEQMKVVYVHQIATEDIEKWRNKRIEKVSKATANRELKMIKTFLKQCVEKGYLLKSPAQNIRVYKEPERAIRHLSDDEITKLLNAAPKDLKQIIIFLLLTGMRYGELCHLEWSDIDFRRGQIIIQPKPDWNPKNFKKRVLPMHPKVHAILSGLPKGSSSYLFPDENGKPSDQGLRNRLYRVFFSAKVKGNVKDLRSTFASNAVMSGLPIYTVSKLLGHHDVKITEKHYAHLAPDYMGNAITMLKSEWVPSAKGLIEKTSAN
jgi:integrase